MKTKIKLDIDVVKEVKRASRQHFQHKPTKIFKNKKKTLKKKYKEDYSEEV